MHKINKRIELVRSELKGYSSLSILSSTNMLRVLSKKYTHVHITILNSVSDLDKLVKRKPDLVFLGMHFLPKNTLNEKDDHNRIWISKYLDAHHIAYTGSDNVAGLLSVEKSQAKLRANTLGLRTAKYYVSKVSSTTKPNQVLSFPMFAKPNNTGGGTGIDNMSVVHDKLQLHSKIDALHIAHGADVLVEEYLSGREFSVAILQKDNPHEFLVMPLELVAPLNHNGDRVLTGAVKKADTENHYLIEDKNLFDAVSTLALKVFLALGARDYGRIDIRLDANKIPHFIEANLIPSLTDKFGNFPKACILNEGISYDEMLNRIVNLGLTRNKQLLVT